MNNNNLSEDKKDPNDVKNEIDFSDEEELEHTDPLKPEVIPKNLNFEKGNENDLIINDTNEKDYYYFKLREIFNVNNLACINMIFFYY